MKDLVLRFLAVLFLANLVFAICFLVTLQFLNLGICILLVFPLSAAIIKTIEK